MKLLLLFFFVGCATASIYDELAERVFTGLMLEQAEMETFSMYSEDDVKTELGKKLKEKLKEVLERIKERINEGKLVGKDLKDKVKGITDKLRDLKMDIGEKAKEMLKNIKDRIKSFWEDMLNNAGGSKRSVDEFDIVDQLAVTKMKEMFNKLKDYLRQNVDKDMLKKKVHEIFGKGNELADSLLEIIQKKGEEWKNKLYELIDRYLEKKETEKRSMKELWEKIKNYFKDLHIDLQEKYAKFGEWVKDNLEKAKEKGKSKIENIKDIAKKFIENGKGAGKDIAAEALEFLRPYKDDLGSLFDQVKDTVKAILTQKD